MRVNQTKLVFISSIEHISVGQKMFNCTKTKSVSKNEVSTN